MIVRDMLIYVLLVYAVYVPSTARRTLLLAALMTLPLLGCICLAFRKYDPVLMDPPAANWPRCPVARTPGSASTSATAAGAARASAIATHCA